MLADTEAELHAMAKRLGLQRSWYQAKASTPHYDLSPGRHELAIRYGAELLERLAFVERLRAIRAKRDTGAW
jgi:hypothetical protein